MQRINKIQRITENGKIQLQSDRVFLLCVYVCVEV